MTVAGGIAPRSDLAKDVFVSEESDVMLVTISPPEIALLLLSF